MSDVVGSADVETESGKREMLVGLSSAAADVSAFLLSCLSKVGGRSHESRVHLRALPHPSDSHHAIDRTFFHPHPVLPKEVY